ncbi:DUF3012 domain-containing protein [Pseudomaricurvus alkylphenolicus]|uniref:DUF3012 domain-containing protein n=1 Tax=Pseudomaricurvus alkylphenolicus TaxID=1306991 RepID=UPI00142258C5|nr:DUF3012 domain-containing protein [Pseudomaricurvus alkylphenolicus]NIB43722.1 DUF3012 domain-containing protein [Pseudomaricurvus alkylphenolicus]
MKKYLGVLCLLLFACASIFVGLSIIEGGGDTQLQGEAWCDAMVEKPNQEWTDAETRSFARTCLYE